MKSQFQYKTKKQPYRQGDAILKATALLYLQEALVTEKYEDAPNLIDKAYQYGAQRKEVRKVIERYIRKQKIANGAQPTGGRQFGVAK